MLPHPSSKVKAGVLVAFFSGFQKPGFKWTISTLNSLNGHSFIFYTESQQLELNLRGLINSEIIDTGSGFNFTIEIFDEYDEGFVKIIENNKTIYNLLVKN